MGSILHVDLVITHMKLHLEVPLSDNDNIGLVLSTIKDDEGIYGPSGSTQSLLLTFNSAI